MRIVLVLAFWLLLAGTANAAIVNVTRTDDPAPDACQPTDCSLREAIQSANSGDTVQLLGDIDHNVVHTLTRGTLLITKDLTIQGGGSSVSRIDGLGNGADRIMKIDDHEVTIADLTFQNAFQGRDEVNSSNPLAHNGGGALYSVDGETTVQRVVFESNYSPALMGAGISADRGTLSLTDVDLHESNAYYGSALFLRGATVSINRSTISGGANSRGAVYLASGNLAMTNSTVTGNGQSNSVGGGVVNAGGTLSLASATLADNVRGGLMTYDGATTQVTNTLFGTDYEYACVPNNTVSEAGPAITNDLGHNLVADNSCPLTHQTSQANALLRLAPLANNGGRTPTMALLWGNSAIGAGGICPPADQREVPRQGACDVGAFEAKLLGVPDVTTLSPPTQIQAREATVAAELDLKGEAGALRIDVGTTQSNMVEWKTVGAGVIADPEQRTVVLQGLEPDTTYYYQAIAFNATGAAVGDTKSFTTGPEGPGVGGIEVTDVTDTGVKVSTTIDPNGHATSYIVKWTSANGSGQIGPFDAGAGVDGVSITKTITGLKPGTDYLVDVIATSVGGTTGSYSPAEITTRPQLTGRVGSTVTLTESGEPCEAGAFVDWGDDTRGEAFPVSCAAGAYTLTATHVYERAGHFQILITYESGTLSEAWAEIAPPLPAPDPGVTVTPTPEASPQPGVSPTPTVTPTPTPDAPITGKTVVAQPSGIVLIKVNGKFVPLKPGSVPLGSQIDVTKGRVTIFSIPKPGAPAESATFYGGIFTVTQVGGVTILKLSGPEPTCKAKASAGKKVKTRKLWGEGKGSFRTQGKYSAATVRGTRWLVQDSCSGTLTQVKSGVVSVRDNVKGKTIMVRAGKQYLARPRR